MGLILSTGLSLGSCLAGQAACCFTSAACRCFANLSCESSKATRAAYSILFFVNSVISWIMMSDWVNHKLSNATYGYLKLDCEDCHGLLATQRINFAIALFHFGMAAITIGIKNSKSTRAGIQNGFWGPKIIIWIGLIVAGNNYIALFGAGIFVILQLILLVDFAHTFSEKLIDSYEASGDRLPMYLLVGMTVSLVMTSIVLTGVLYGIFGQGSCKLNQFYITINLLLCLGVCALSVAPHVREVNSRSGLAQSTIVAAYATYLVLSAVANEPADVVDDTSCNPLAATRSSQTLTVILGTLFTFIAINYSTSSTAVKSTKILGEDQSTEDASVPLLSNNGRTEQQQASLEAAVESGALPASVLRSTDQINAPRLYAGPTELYPTQDEAEHVAYSYSFFHIVFGLASMYVAMLLTNWNTMTIINTDQTAGLLVQIGKSWTAVWVKIASSWIVLALYSWTLIAPLAFPNREWTS